MRPVVRSSTLITRCPSASRRSARCEPMNPAPPVTRTVLTRSTLAAGRRRCRATCVPHEPISRRRGRRSSPRCRCTAAIDGNRHLEPGSSLAGRASRSRSRVFATTPPPSSTVGAPTSVRGGDRLRHLHVDDRLLEAGAARSGRSQILPRRPRGLDVAQHGRLQPAHREVEVAAVLPSPAGSGWRAGRPAVPRRRGPDRPGTRARAGALPCRTPRPPRRRASGRARRDGSISGTCTSIVCPPLTIRAT